MSRSPRVLVKLRSGQTCVYDVTCKEDFDELEREISSIFCVWLKIGGNSLVKKKHIVGIFYVEGSDEGSE